MISNLVILAIILRLITIPALAWPQGQDDDGIRHQVRMLEQLTAQTERTRTVAQQTAREMAEVERQLASERDPEVRKDLLIRFENLRLLMLRRTILQKRAELKQQEFAEHLNALKTAGGRSATLPRDQSRRARRDVLTRRLQSAEELMQLMTNYHRTAATDQERVRIGKLIEEEKKVIAEIRQALDKSQ